MKILSLQGYFGNLEGQCIEFDKGFSCRVLPNGWGKTTVCAFLRVMLYGLNTSRRDTQTALSDKTHYMPRSGKPMSGRMAVDWQGRTVIITRSTGKGGLMQEFDAFYEDTGEKCLALNAKNCGQMLLGLGEDGFLSSVFVDGAALQRPSDELRERMLEMAQTGETQGRATDALRVMERWRLDLDSGNGHGEIPRLQVRLSELDSAEQQLTELETETAQLQQQATAMQQEEETARTAYDRAYRAFAAKTAGSGGERLEALIEESSRLVRELDQRLPPEQVIREAAEALYGYEGAQKLEREKREKLPGGRTRYEQALDELEEEQRQDEIARNEAGRLHIRWFPLLLAFVFACASAATNLLNVTWGPYTKYAVWALPVLAVIGLIAAFAGCVRKTELPPVRNFKAERQALLREHEHENAEQDTASAVLQDAHNALLCAAQKLDAKIATTEQAEQAVRRAQNDLQSLRREQAALQELLMQRTKLPNGGDLQRDDIETLRDMLVKARARAEQARQRIAQLQGRAQALGTRDGLRIEREELQIRLHEAEFRIAAVCEAIELTQQAQAALSSRISPHITERARDYMEFLTDGEYCEVQLDASLSARCAGDDGQLLDALRLSAGTRDQLYFALRLAVSNVLGDAADPCPLILDDPFLTFDDARTMRAVELLRRLGEERQVILFSCRELA